MTESSQANRAHHNGVHREVERRAAHFAPGADPTLQEEPLIEELDEPSQHAGTRPLTPPKPLIIAAATVFAAAAFFMLRGRSKPSRLGRFRPSPAEKSLLLRGLEKGGLSLIALAVQRLGTRGLDHWLGSGAEALPEAATPERQTPAVGHAV